MSAGIGTSGDAAPRGSPPETASRDARPGTGSRAAAAAALAAVAAVFLLVLSLCVTFLTDTDLGWHLAAGDWIRRMGRIPRAEPFSFTVIGHRWIDIHWLFQVVLSMLYGAGGARALELARAAAIVGTFAWLYRSARRFAGRTTVAAILLLAALACQERFLVRPELVSWGLLLAVLAVLDRALAADSRAARTRPLFVVLPILQILWVNVQGLFILEPVFIALALGVALLDLIRPGAGPPERRDPDRPVDFLMALAASALASLVNPYGPAALRLPFEQFFVHLGGSSLLSRTIAEFQPPLSGYLPTPAIGTFVVLAAVTLLAIVADFPRVRRFDVAVIAATLLLAMRARRNLPLFALPAAVVLARHAAALVAPIRARLARLAPAGPAPRIAGAARALPAASLALLTLGLTFAVVTDRFFLLQPTERWFGLGEIPDYFPDETARYVEDAGLPGNVFHSLSVGGFLIHAWRGERGVFIDGRNDPYVDDVLPQYLRAVADPAAFEEIAGRYQIAAVLWPHQRALEGKTLLSYLARGHGWVLVHLDPGGAVYLRADLQSPAHIETTPFQAGPDRRSTYDDLARELRDRPFHGPPLREIALGQFFSVSGDPAGAEYFYAKALDRLPGSAVVLYGYALALERQGKSKEARGAYARAVAADPSYLPARAALGACAIDEGRLQEAQEHLDAAWRGGERSARLCDARARLFEARGDSRQAIAAYVEAIRLAPRDTALLRALAAFYVRHDEASSALPFYTTASQIDPDDPVIAREMATVLVRLGRKSAALDVSRDAAGRALNRLSGGGAGWGGAGSGVDEDRQLLLFAADLEMQSGDSGRAADYRSALARGGGAAPQ